MNEGDICPKCGWTKKPKKIEWAYTPTSHENRMDAIKKSEIRMKEESGYGIPEKEDIAAHDPENLGSVITGIWRKEWQPEKKQRK